MFTSYKGFEVDAVRRLPATLRRLAKNADLRTQYCAFTEEYL